jgi:hypothetical protein
VFRRDGTAGALERLRPWSGLRSPVAERVTPEGSPARERHSTVTLFARFRGWSTLHPRSTAMWYASN